MKMKNPFLKLAWKRKQKRADAKSHQRSVLAGSIAAVAASVLSLAGVSSAGAATFTWGNNTGAWSTGSNWTGGIDPTSDPTNILIFGGGGPGYTATDDIIGLNPILLNQISLNNLTTLADTIAATGTTSFSFAGAAAPQITQNGLGAFIISVPITLDTNGLTFNGTGPGQVTLSGVITGPGSPLTFSGYNTTVLSGNNSSTLTGDITINSGTLSVATDGAASSSLGVSNNQIIFGTLGGGTLQLTGTFGTLQATRNVVLNGNGTFDVATSATIAGTISGNGSLFKRNTGTLTLTGGS
ncbi:MAG: hypothetical protein ABI318_08900, partial [Chthoniobacteraceae bacterium]